MCEPRLTTAQAHAPRLVTTTGSIRDGNGSDDADDDGGGDGGGGGGGSGGGGGDDDDDDDGDVDDIDSCNFSEEEMGSLGRFTGDSDASGGSSLTRTSYTPQFSIQATMYFGIIDFLQVRQCARCRVRAALTRCCARACRSGT